MTMATQFSVAVNGDIRWVSGTDHFTVLELHRFLQGIADDQAPATADDYVDITSLTPSERSTDSIIKLINGYNIDDTVAEYLYGGSVRQGAGITETVYSGLKVLGAVNTSTTQIQVIQNNDYYDTTSPFWGDQSGGGYNGDAGTGTLMRILVKTRENGADIDGKRVRVQVRTWGDSYDFFNVTLGDSESVAAVSSTPDAQNTTAIATVQAWSSGDIPTNTEGWQLIDILNGNGDKEYYSKWTYNTNALAMRAVYEWIKEITGNDSPEAADPYGMNGEVFLGITHSFAYTGTTGDFTQNEKVAWGTLIDYDTKTGVFAYGEFVTIERASVQINSGRILWDNDTNQMLVALDDITTALADGDIITEASARAKFCTIDTTIVDDDVGGGEGIMLAENTTDDDMYIQLIYGVAPIDTLEIRGLTSGDTCDVSGSVTPQTVPKISLGSYTVSLIGAFGIGIDPDDLLSTDTVQPLVGAAQTPPNNVTFSLSGINVGDRILIGNKDTGNDFEWDEMTLAVALDANGETEVNVGAGNIPADTPASGILRITLNNGEIKYQAYNSHDGDDAFAITSSDYLAKPAAITNGVMIAFIDKAAAADPEEFTIQYDSPRTLWVRVREGTSATPMKTFESQAALGATGGSAVASRIDDY